LISELSKAGVNLHVTAIMTLEQVKKVSSMLKDNTLSLISVFAGRIADTGVEPVPFMAEALKIMSPYKTQELLWASPRELFNIFQAEEIGCHIITVNNDILKKLELVGKDLAEFSLETVKMF